MSARERGLWFVPRLEELLTAKQNLGHAPILESNLQGVRCLSVQAIRQLDFPLRDRRVRRADGCCDHSRLRVDTKLDLKTWRVDCGGDNLVLSPEDSALDSDRVRSGADIRLVGKHDFREGEPGCGIRLTVAHFRHG